MNIKKKAFKFIFPSYYHELELQKDLYRLLKENYFSIKKENEELKCKCLELEAERDALLILKEN